MGDDLKTTIKKLVKEHLNKKIGKVFGQCLTAVGWVGGTLPELYEDNDEFIINNKLISSNTYNAKKKKTKNNILNDNFGISSHS